MAHGYQLSAISHLIGKIILGKNRMHVISQGKKVASIACAFCGGKGNDPFGIMSHISTCCVCKGKGTVRVLSPYRRCAHCSGTGAVKTLTCPACMGKGVLPLAA